MTLSPCCTLKNAKPNRCVFKCFAKVSKPKEEDLKPTGEAFQLLGPATAKDLRSQTPVTPMTRNNNVTMSSRSQTRSTRHQRSNLNMIEKLVLVGTRVLQRFPFAYSIQEFPSRLIPPSLINFDHTYHMLSLTNFLSYEL